MERWRPETNTFHMYHREVSITLQDVAHLTDLSVSGNALYVEYKKETNWAAVVEDRLGNGAGLGRVFLYPSPSPSQKFVPVPVPIPIRISIFIPVPNPWVFEYPWVSPSPHSSTRN
ncbi:Serine/threonine-protein phosphatase 7 long form homolog [Linum grandiflorum]